MALHLIELIYYRRANSDRYDCSRAHIYDRVDSSGKKLQRADLYKLAELVGVLPANGTGDLSITSLSAFSLITLQAAAHQNRDAVHSVHTLVKREKF